jgi:biopolymer transport protein ExbD
MNPRRGILKKMHFHAGPNMTAMVDIVMCILIFFMLGTSLATPELFLKSSAAAVDTEGLNSVPGAQKLPAVRLFIRLTRATVGGKEVTAVSVFNEDPLPMRDIKAPNEYLSDPIYQRLVARRPSISDEAEVLIAPEQDIRWQDIVTLQDYCAKLQFKNVKFPVK